MKAKKTKRTKQVSPAHVFALIEKKAKSLGVEVMGMDSKYCSNPEGLVIKPQKGSREWAEQNAQEWADLGVREIKSMLA